MRRETELGGWGPVMEALLLDLDREGDSALGLGGGGGGGKGSVESRLDIAYDGKGGLFSAEVG